jgi:hypothetical protein
MHPTTSPSRTYTEADARRLLDALRLPIAYGTRVFIGAGPSPKTKVRSLTWCWACSTTNGTELNPCSTHPQVIA